MGRRTTVFAVVFIVLLAVVKVHLHFVRLLILAAAGLGGLYLLHLLAQDYNRIRQPVKPAAAAGPAVRAITKLLFRRSADTYEDPVLHALKWQQDEDRLNEIADLDYILKQDPSECARKVVCELSATSRTKLLADERAILDFLGAQGSGVGSVGGGDGAGGGDGGSDGRAAFERAAQLGRRWRERRRCAEEYSKCHYDAWQVLKLLRGA